MSPRSGVLAAVTDFLVEPLDVAPAEPSHLLPEAAPATVAVIGLSSRCGATTVARALGAELAIRADCAAAVVTAEGVTSGGVPLGTPAAARLTRAMARAVAERMRPVGRLCLTTCSTGAEAALADAAHGIAPLVLDVTDSSHASVAASLADAVVLVVGPATEPALAPVVAASLGRVGPEPVVVLNRDRGDSDEWRDRCAIVLPESRIGAQLAQAGREPRSNLGRSISALADLAVGVA
ncbi:MAG: hypothetical protein WD993_07235 [Thermoleophilaceae bacterium]